MRRRRNQSPAGGNLDSLLDTMTNVVGILVIVLVMTQVNIADAVRRLRADLPQVSAQQMEELVAESAQIEEELKLLRSPAAEFDPSELDAAKAQVGLLRADLEKEKKLAKPEAEMQQLVAARDKALAAAQAAAKLAKEKLSGLRSDLESAKALAGRPPVRVRLPDPRPAREDSGRVLFACIGERVYYIDEAGLMAKTKAAIEKGGAKLVHSVEGEGSKRRSTYKRAESEKHIVARKIGDAMATVTLRTYPDRHYGNLMISPRPDGGDAISAMRESGRGAVRKRMQKAFLDRDYIYFAVAPDAFATYLEARRIAEVDHNLPVGWEFVDPNWKAYKGLSGVRFEHTPPPPPKPNPNPPAKPPVKPPPKKPNVLD